MCSRAPFQYLGGVTPPAVLLTIVGCLTTEGIELVIEGGGQAGGGDLAHPPGARRRSRPEQDSVVRLWRRIVVADAQYGTVLTPGVVYHCVRAEIA